MSMTKADQYLVSDIKNILENGYKDIDPRPKYEDGTPAHTISVNHVTRKYDLSRGEFPICTLRKQAWKTGIREISDHSEYTESSENSVHYYTLDGRRLFDKPSAKGLYIHNGVKVLIK